MCLVMYIDDILIMADTCSGEDVVSPHPYSQLAGGFGLPRQFDIGTGTEELAIESHDFRQALSANFCMSSNLYMSLFVCVRWL